MGCGSSSHAKSEPSVPTGNLDPEPQPLTGGGLNHYHRSLQGLSGLPAPNLDDGFLMKQMMEEHCHMRGHDAKFDCSLHYESKDGKAPVPVTTAKEEWEYVTNGTAPSWLKLFKAKDGENHKREARVFIEYNEELKKDPNKQKAEILSAPERLGLALYTGPMYKVYNNILRKTKGFAEKFVGDLVVSDAQDAKPAPSSLATSWGALRAVYTNAELLRLQVFEKFDRNSDLCIDRKEVNETIIKLLTSKDLSDNMMRVVDYFSAVDKNRDGIIEFEEAFGHCFPYVPERQRGTLLKWLHPQKYDPVLYRVMEEFAMKKASPGCLNPTPAKDFDTELSDMNKQCERILEERKKAAEQHLKNMEANGISDTKKREEHEAEIERFNELTGVGKGFVSNFTLAIILKDKNKDSTSAAKTWLDQQTMASGKMKNSDPSLIPNTFSATIFVISSAIQKLSRQELSPNPINQVDRHLFRGLANSKVLGSGYCEFAFLSSSKNEKIAANIAYESNPNAKSILVLQINAPIGGFACIKKYSQFPVEEEWLFAPTAFIRFEEESLQPQPELCVMSGRQISKTVKKVTVFPSVAPTIDSLREQEKLMHLQLFRFNRAELSQMLENRLRGWLKNKKGATTDVDTMLLSAVCDDCDLNAVQATAQKVTGPVSTKEIFERILFQYDEVLAKHQEYDHTKYGKDDFFRQRTSEMLDNKRWCEHKLELWLQNRENGSQGDLAIGIFFYPLEQCFKIWITNLRREIVQSRRSSEPTKDPHLDPKKLRREFLKAKGLISESDSGIKDLDILPYLGLAAVNGWSEEDLLALLELCDNVKDIIIKPIEPKKLPSCLHLAAAHGNSFFLDTVLSYVCKKSLGIAKTEWKLDPTIVHNQGGDDGKAESPLYMASENGHSNCIEVLVRFCPELPKFALSPLCVAISRTHVSCVKLLVAFALKNPTLSLINDASYEFTPLMRAVSRGDIDIVRLLLWAGADISGLGSAFGGEADGSNSHGNAGQSEAERGNSFEEMMLQQKCYTEDNKVKLQHLLKKRREKADLNMFRRELESTDSFTGEFDDLKDFPALDVMPRL